MAALLLCSLLAASRAVAQPAPAPAPVVDAGASAWTPIAALLGLTCGVGAAACIPIALVSGALAGCGGTATMGSVSIFALFGGLSSITAQLVALGPCGSCLAGVGGTAGALIGGRRWWVALLGALPGAAIGMIGSGLVAGALFGVYSNNNRGVVPDPTTNRLWTLVAVPGAAAVLLSGPLAMGGATAADLWWGAPAPN